MGCSFYECDECKDCKCDFSWCEICKNVIYICLDCVKEQQDNIFNVIYCEGENDKYGNLDYLAICDDCFEKYKTLTDEQCNKLTNIKMIKQHIDSVVERFNNYQNHLEEQILLKINKTEIKLTYLYDQIKIIDPQYKSYFIPYTEIEIEKTT